MADTVDNQIYRLSIDGTAYLEGVDKLSASTNKLSEAQEKANAKLAELQKTSDGLKKSLNETNTVLKSNEKETIEYTKQLNTLIATEKGATAEANKLRDSLKFNATEYKNLKSEAKDLTTNLTTTTNQIKLQTKEIDGLGKSSVNFTQGLSRISGGLNLLSSIIPTVGIAGLFALISGPVIKAFGEWYDSINQTSRALNLLKANQQNVNDVMEAADKDAGKQITDLKILYETATNVNLSMSDRLAAVKALQLEFPEYFKNIKAETILNGQATEQYNALAASILATARATAAKTKLDQLEAQQLDKDFERQKVINATTREAARARDRELSASTGGGSFGGGGTSGAVTLTRAEQLKVIENRRDARLKKIQEDKQDLQAQEDFLIKFAGLTNIAKVIEETDAKKFKDKAGRQTKVIVNIYAEELQKLKIEIAKLDEKGFTNEASITKAIEEDFKRRTAAFQKALDKGQLTKGQFTSLNKKLAELQKLTLDQSIKSFNDQRAALLQKIDNELSSIEDQTALKRIASIQDSYEKQRQTIVFENDKLIKTREQARDKEIAEIKKSTILTPAEIQIAVSNVEVATADFIQQIRANTSRQLQQLSFDTFEKISEDLQRRLKDKNIDLSALTLIDINKQTELLQQGRITYEQYQKELTRISKEESDKRRELEIANLRIEINRRQSELRTNQTLTDTQQEKLLNEIRDKEGQIDTLQRGDKVDKPAKKRIDAIQQYAQAIGNLVQNVIAFWQLANKAESEALDRSIALQEKRVDAAQKIAERGNAQYLKQEEDRLTQLNIQKENAARKQLGINAALQGSEILVALISGLAQGAKIGGGLGAIASVAAIVAAIAGAFAVAQSLKPPSFTFFKGTKDTGPGGDIDSRGGFAATLHPHEAVTPADKNKAYHPVIDAIHDGTIPSDHLNAFVKRYHHIKTVPQPNYTRIKEAAELHIGQDGRMSVLLSEHSNLLKENNELQRLILKKKGVHAEFKVDKNGVGMMVTEYMEQIERNKKT